MLLAAAAVPASAQAATSCDPLDKAGCLLPFPNDAFTRADKSTPIHRRLAVRNALMPKNNKGKPIDAAPYNAFDGFSPGSTILTKVPGLDTPKALAKTNPVGLAKLSRYTAKSAPVLVVDENSGKRWPIWVELDSNATSAKNRLLEIHPTKNFLEGHTYVVALRNLKRANGKRIGASSAFAKLRAARKPGARYAAIFKPLTKAKVKRDKSLFLAWDFTVAS